MECQVSFGVLKKLFNVNLVAFESGYRNPFLLSSKVASAALNSRVEFWSLSNCEKARKER